MTILKRGMIVDVNLDPTLGSETGKIRPCIVVTNNVYNERVPIIQVVPITQWSAKKNVIVTTSKYTHPQQTVFQRNQLLTACKHVQSIINSD